MFADVTMLSEILARRMRLARAQTHDVVCQRDLAAMSIHVSASQFYGQTYAGGSLSLETAASWLVIVAAQERRFGLIAISRALKALQGLLSELPLGDLDERATGAEVAWYREAFTHPGREDAYWGDPTPRSAVRCCCRATRWSTTGRSKLAPTFSPTRPSRWR